MRRPRPASRHRSIGNREMECGCQNHEAAQVGFLNRILGRDCGNGSLHLMYVRERLEGNAQCVADYIGAHVDALYPLPRGGRVRAPCRPMIQESCIRTVQDS